MREAEIRDLESRFNKLVQAIGDLGDVNVGKLIA
jgi:hypothetical protein